MPVIPSSLENLAKFKDYLLKDNESPKLNTQYGTQIVPVGNYRLRIVEWMHSLIYLKEKIICQKFQEIGLPKALLTLIKKYDMNSNLHLKIYSIFSEAIGIDDDLWVETVIFE